MYPFDDIGIPGVPNTYSWPNLLNEAHKSGLIGPLPLLFDTSDVRPITDGYSYHATGNAVDFGNNAGNAGSLQMDSFCRWWAQNYGPYSLEIIHVYQSGETEEWKFGVKKPTGWYGWDTLNAHKNHVHTAITNNGITDYLQNHVKELWDIMPLINFNTSLNMNADPIRKIRYLLAACGVWYDPTNADHLTVENAVKWYQRYCGIPDDAVVGSITWQKLLTQSVKP